MKISDIKAKEELMLSKLSDRIISWAGSSSAFVVACLCIIVWGISGPMLHYSEIWQLLINTLTSVVTFLMVFLIQKSQNKDSKAIQLKLDELIAADHYASNRMVKIEDLTEAELNGLQEFYMELANRAKKNTDIKKTHSIDSAGNFDDKGRQNVRSRRRRRPRGGK